MLASNQEMEQVSFLDKLGTALYSMCTGIVLFGVMLGVAGWNEYRNVAMMKTISAGREAFKQATCSLDSRLEGQLVHASCTLTNLKHLGQNIDGVRHMRASQMTGLSLHTTTEVFAWQESVQEKKTQNSKGGGDTITKTYTYYQAWTSTTPTAVSSFYKTGEECRKANKDVPCANIEPSTDADFTSAAATANKLKLGTHVVDTSTGVKFGDYTLPEDMTSKLGTATPITPSCFPTRRALSPEQLDRSSSRRPLSAPSSAGRRLGEVEPIPSSTSYTPIPSTTVTTSSTPIPQANGGGGEATPAPNPTNETNASSYSETAAHFNATGRPSTPANSSSTSKSIPRPALCDHNATKFLCKDEVRVFFSHALAKFLSFTN